MLKKASSGALPMVTRAIRFLSSCLIGKHFSSFLSKVIADSLSLATSHLAWGVLRRSDNPRMLMGR